MPISITAWVIGTALALATISFFARTAAVEQRQTLVNRQEPPLSEAAARVGNHQQLRKLFFDESRERLR